MMNRGKRADKSQRRYSFRIMKKLTTVWYSTVGAALALAPVAASAVTNPFEQGQKLAKDVGTNAGIAEGKGLTEIIGSIINVVLGFLGIVFLVLLLYAGFLWMTAGGDEGKVKQARGMISQAVIGLVIIVAAFAISNFVLGSLVNVTK